MTKTYADTCLERAEKASPGSWDKEPRNSNYSTWSNSTGTDPFVISLFHFAEELEAPLEEK